MHSSGAARALYHVFIRPVAIAPIRIQISPLTPLPRIPIYTQVTRAFSRGTPKQPTSTTKYGTISTDLVLDEAIRSRYINFVDRNGVFHRSKGLRDVLQTVNRSTSHLVLVSPRNEADPDSLPTCKIMTKEGLKEAERQKMKKRVNTSIPKKSLEINWAVDQHDLQRYIRRLQEFLEDGKKVEVLFLKGKKGARSVTLEACETIVAAVKDSVQDLDSVGGLKKTEGRLGENMTLHFEGSTKKETKEDSSEIQKTSTTPSGEDQNNSDLLSEVQASENSGLSKYQLKQMRRQGLIK